MWPLFYSRMELDRFLKKLMEVERKYGHAFPNAERARKRAVREVIEEFVAQGLRCDIEKNHIQ
jgi:hypothetical protein